MTRCAPLLALVLLSACDPAKVGETGDPSTESGTWVDGDGDGFTDNVDCDDDDATVNPGVDDTPGDGVDQDCDGEDAAEGSVDTDTGGGGSTFTDADSDGYPDTVDCDDADASVNPGASEVWYDGTDQDCDGADGAASSLKSGEFLITEILQNPDVVGDADGEWFEIYNNSSYSWNLNGLYVTDGAGTEMFEVDEETIVSSHAYVVLAINADPDQNGGVDSASFDWPGGDFGLGNGEDAIYLYPSSSSSSLIDSVAWDNGDSFPDPNGASMSLKSASYSASGNNNGSAWCTATSHIADDAANDYGTPGESNDCR